MLNVIHFKGKQNNMLISTSGTGKNYTWTFCRARFSLSPPPWALNLGTSLRAAVNTPTTAATAMSIVTDR